MITDDVVQRDVLEELRDEPSVDASHIGVAAKDGVVTLSGVVGTYTEKIVAGEAAKRVYGVHGVADELMVRLPEDKLRIDGDIARAALDALRWHSLVPDDAITITVDRGWLTLEGTVDWQYQRDAAAAAVRHLTGVRGVTDLISIRPGMQISAAEVKRRIYDAFRRSAELEARRIGIDAHDGVVVLHGNVRGWTEAQEAQRAAYAVPGVVEVENRLSVVP